MIYLTNAAKKNSSSFVYRSIQAENPFIDSVLTTKKKLKIAKIHNFPSLKLIRRLHYTR